MTRKDYELIARVLNTWSYLNDKPFWAVKFADELEKAYPNFNRERFIKAVTKKVV